MTHEPFRLSQQLINTLRGGIIAAYDPRAERDRIGWIAVVPELTPTFEGNVWTYAGVRLEVTLDSYDEVRRRQEAQQDFEEGEVLMVTRHARVTLASLESVHAFFARHVERPEFVRSADFVEFPEDLSDPRPWKDLTRVLEHRRVARALLRAQRREVHARIDLGQSTLVGYVVSVERTSCRLLVASSHTFEVSFWSLTPRDVSVVEDGGFQALTADVSLDDVDALPLWSYAEDRWVEEGDGRDVDEEHGGGLGALSGMAAQAMGVTALRRFCDHHDIRHAEIDAFVERRFALITVSDFARWERETTLLDRLGGQHDLPPNLLEAVGSPNVVTFRYLLQKVKGIGTVDLWGDTTEWPWRYLRAALAVLDAHDISRPDVTPFLKSRATRENAWGWPVPEEVVSLWRTLR
ncbi:hypothetical protein [Deinococcus pimensis]|uniref:hypothetical protein n=1 Tax=Deinococcus pimensis TaxID=309888 RepID=UPI0004882EE5|nr:hypothetical protein [Deinococcus pimensis]